MKNVKTINFDDIILSSLFIFCIVVCLTLLVGSYIAKNNIKTNEITNTSVNKWETDTTSWIQPW